MRAVGAAAPGDRVGRALGDRVVGVLTLLQTVAGLEAPSFPLFPLFPLLSSSFFFFSPLSSSFSLLRPGVGPISEKKIGIREKLSPFGRKSAPKFFSPLPRRILRVGTAAGDRVVASR